MHTRKFHSKVAADSNPLPGNLALQCSCSACDSIACFARRQLRTSCSCNECPDTKLDHSIFNTKTSRNSIIEKISTELIKNEVTYYDYEKIENKLNNKDNIVEKRSQVLFGTRMVAERDENKSSRPKSAAQLSAQIMNVPYEHFEESFKKSEPLHNLTTLSPFDIIKKIKDVYKACSCKVCDCIVGNTQKNEFCACKPCDCDDCKNYNSTMIVRSRVKDEKRSRVFTRCERPYVCRAVTKLAAPQECDCGRCECIKCVNDVSAPCDCEPCQCIECNTKHFQLQRRQNALIVAAVGEDYETRRPCDCRPCECIECGHGGLSTAPPPIRHEMSTGLNRHPHCRCDTCTNDACLPDGTDTCRCERRNRIVRKPVTSDNNDYDIRSALIHQSLMHLNRNKGRDAIAMFAAVNNTYRKHHTPKCKCDECECLKCNYNYANAVKSSKVLINSTKTPNSNYSKNKRTNYAHACPKKTHKESPSQYHCTGGKLCKCDMCVCLNYNQKPKPTSKSEFKADIYEQSDKVDCSCAPCECTDCQRGMYRCPGDLCHCTSCKCKNCIDSNLSEVAHPVKREKMFSTENVDTKLKDLFLESSTEFPHNDLYYFDCSPRYSNKKLQKLNTRIETVKQKLLDVDQPQDITANVRSINKGTIDLQRSPSLISANSLASYYMKDSGSLSPLSGRRNKSWESSCNSSGHDCPNYLVQFPKNTVETCLNDVLQLHLRSSYSPDESNFTRNMKTVKKPINTSTTFWEYDDKTSSSTRPIKNHVKKDKLSFDECSSVNSKSLHSEFNKIPNQIRRNVKEDSNTTGQIGNCGSKRKHESSRLIDYNKYFEDTKKEFYNESYQNRKHRIKKDFMLDEDYERVQKTLEDAREFSQHLIRLLEKYEKANNDFESVSQKLKYPTSCINTLGFNNDDIIPELMQSKILNATGKQSEENVPTKNNNNMRHDKCKDIMIDRMKHVMKNSGDEVIIQFKKDKLKDLSLKNHEYDYSDIEFRLNYENSLNPIMEEKEPSPDRSSTKQRVKRTKLTYNKMYKRAINVSMKPKVLPNVTLNCASTETSKGLVSDNIDTVNNKSKEDKGIHNLNLFENADVDASAVVDALRCLREQNVPTLEDKVIRMIKPPAEIMQAKVVENPQIPILKEDYCIEADHEPFMKEIDTGPDINNDNNLQRITWDSDKQDIENHRESNTLINLHLEVKQRSAEFQSHHHSEKIKRPSSSLENLKVNRLRVRRVSDHTVMVKWDTPRALHYVDGYEIILDGKAIKKILSASSCMAVVTCLPNVNQLLLTVRTVTSYKTSVGHTPTATIIYRPREKNEVCCALCNDAF